MAHRESLARPNVPLALDTVIRGLFDDSLRGLRDPHRTNDRLVHDTRKRLKRLRSLLPLLEALEQERLTRADQLALGLVARSLGRVRAPAAELEAWRHFSSCVAPAAAATVEVLLDERLFPAPVVARRLRRSARIFNALRQRLMARAANASAPEEYDHEAFLDGLQRAYRKARRALRQAQAKPTWERLHALRRASKYHRYQLQLLELFFGARIKPARSKVARLTDKLGEHHDLGAIERYLAGQPTFVNLPHSKQTLKKLRRRLNTLQERCLHAAGKSFHERPKAFGSRIRRYFESAARVSWSDQRGPRGAGSPEGRHSDR